MGKLEELSLITGEPIEYLENIFGVPDQELWQRIESAQNLQQINRVLHLSKIGSEVCNAAIAKRSAIISSMVESANTLSEISHVGYVIRIYDGERQKASDKWKRKFLSDLEAADALEEVYALDELEPKDPGLQRAVRSKHKKISWRDFLSAETAEDYARVYRYATNRGDVKDEALKNYDVLMFRRIDDPNITFEELSSISNTAIPGSKTKAKATIRCNERRQKELANLIAAHDGENIYKLTPDSETKKTILRRIYELLPTE